MNWKIGDLCVAKSKQFGWTNSEIKQINEDVANVEFIEYGDSEQVNISDLKLFGPFAVNKIGELVEDNDDAGDYAGWKVGDACVAQWTQNGAWYNSQILHFFNEDEILVRFIDYGNADFTTLGNLKPAGSPLENAFPSSENTIGPWSVGDKCVSRWSEDGLWYKSEILAITGQQVSVLFTQYGNEGVSTLDQLKHEECDESKTSWKVGDLCVAMWNEDNIWYNSQIVDIKGDGVLVRFTDYGNEDYTTLDQLKPFGSLDGASMYKKFTLVKKTSRNERDNQWKVGDLCVARWDEDKVWYDSEIVEIDGEKVSVRFVEYGNEDCTTLDKLKPAGSLASKPQGISIQIDKEKTWAVGDLCVAHWEEDLIWYDSKIMEIHGEKALVQFVHFGNEDFAQLSQLKPAGTLELEDVIKEKGAIPKVKKGTTSQIKKGTVPKVKVSDSEKQLPTSEENRAATEEEISAAKGSINGNSDTGQYSVRNAMSTPEDIAKQLENMFPYFSTEFLIDKASKYVTIENAVNELLNYVQKEAPENIAEQLKNVFPYFSPEFLLDKAREYGTIEIAVNELLNYVQDQDLLKKKEDENDCLKKRIAKSLLLLNEQDMFKKVTLTEKRDFNPDDPLENKFRLAKGHYLSVSRQFAKPIESVDYVENRILMETFERKRSQFKSEGKDAKEYFLFHGTDNVNVDSILMENFQMDYAGKHGQDHGRGIYFSEKTAIPDKYMNGAKKTLLLCRVLLGKEFIGLARDIPEGFDSKSVRPDEDKRADINVIKEVDQILPCFVLNLAPSALDHFDADPFVASRGTRRSGASLMTSLMSFRSSLENRYGPTPTNLPLVGASSATPTNVPQLGASSATPTNVASIRSQSHNSYIQGRIAHLRQYGASSAAPTNVPQSGARSTDSSDSDPALGEEASSYMARFGLVTCPYDASHRVRRDMMQVHITVCRKRPVD